MTVSVIIHVTGQSDRSVSVSDNSLNAVLFDFNPTTNIDVTMIKALCAAVIEKRNQVKASGDPHEARMASIAITQMEITQMCAAKALFAK